MNRSVFDINRASIPRTELAKYQGLWIAFSPNGARIVASGMTLGDADQRVRDAGFDPNEVVFERVPAPDDDICLGSQEFQ